jgi:hypothetical protein
MTIVAIHQPNFFPWLGYFDKIRRADVFVFLDAVSYPRAGSGSMGSWTNRARLHINGEARWVTCPVRRMQLGALICEATIDDAQPWRTKLLKTLETNYRRAARYTSTVEMLEQLIKHPESNLARFNMTAIRRIADHLAINARFFLQSDLSTEGQATDLLVSITKAVGGTSYLAGGGASGYQDDALFDVHNIAVGYQKFAARPYGPPDRFIPGLSVIDYLMYDGRPLPLAFPDLTP